MPTVARMSPEPPTMMPFINADPLRLATMHTPSTAIMKNSGEPKVSTSGLRMGWTG